MANCKRCKVTLDTVLMHKRRSKKAGTYYICDRCADMEKEAYRTSFLEYPILEKDNDYRISIEFQTSCSCTYTEWDTLREEYGWEIIYDKLGYVEYKTPHYKGLNRVTNTLNSIDKILDIAKWNNERDYTSYVYVGNKNFSSDQLRCLYEYYEQIFFPLAKYLSEHPAKTKKIFGQVFPKCNLTVEILNSRFIDVTSHQDIAFKMGKYMSSHQFVNAINIYRKMVKSLDNNFIRHYYSVDFDKRRYKDIEAFRNHKAIITAEKLIDYINKEGENDED